MKTALIIACTFINLVALADSSVVCSGTFRKVGDSHQYRVEIAQDFDSIANTCNGQLLTMTIDGIKAANFSYSQPTEAYVSSDRTVFTLRQNFDSLMTNISIEYFGPLNTQNRIQVAPISLGNFDSKEALMNLANPSCIFNR